MNKYRYKYPDFKLLSQLGDDLIDRKNWPGKDNLWNGFLTEVRPVYEDAVMPNGLPMVTDGNYLIVKNKGGFTLKATIKYIMIVAALFVSLFFIELLDFGMTDEREYKFTIYFVTILMCYFVGRAILVSNVFIFSRDAGTVYVPRWLWKKPFVAKFSGSRVYGRRGPNAGSSINYITWFYPAAVRKGNSLRSHRLELGEVADPAIAEWNWSFICSFMDKSKPLSDFWSLRPQIDWFKRNKAIVPDLFKDKDSKSGFRFLDNGKLMFLDEELFDAHLECDERQFRAASIAVREYIKTS